MTDYLRLADVSKRFGQKTALDNVSLAVGEPSILGLVGKNGSGKTTLLRHIVGLYLPTSGACTTFGRATAELGARELARIGMLHQHDTLIGWMKAEQLLNYVASFYRVWDRELERQLVAMLEIVPSERVLTMSPGNRQKLALVIATCHHPSLLLLDEPLSDLDPIVRRDVVETLLDRFRSDEMAIVISSHLLDDVERIADRIVCLDKGRVVADAPLDDLKERYEEWTVTSPSGTLPAHFAEPYVVAQESDRTRARLTVKDPALHRATFSATYDGEVEQHPLNLEQLFRVLTGATTTRRAEESLV
ncbi:MAG: ABC transporter ATP-binding protein [Gemmatimonadota bacterium]